MFCIEYLYKSVSSVSLSLIQSFIYSFIHSLTRFVYYHVLNPEKANKSAKIQNVSITKNVKYFGTTTIGWRAALPFVFATYSGSLFTRGCRPPIPS